jgi:hypothetical protein
LTAAGKLIAAGTVSANLELYASSSPSGVRRSALVTVGGVTKLNALSDDAASTVSTGLSMDHLSGNVSFPSQMKKSIIPTAESRNNAAYGTLPTPDQVTVVLPTDGLLKILFQATWQESVTNAARAAIFIGANQLVASTTAAATPPVQAASLSPTGSGVDALLTTTVSGLSGAQSAANYTGDLTTGQLVGSTTAGGPCFVFAAAGTYVVSVQFKASSGSVTAKNRKLWVGVEPYS